MLDDAGLKELPDARRKAGSGRATEGGALAEMSVEFDVRRRRAAIAGAARHDLDGNTTVVRRPFMSSR